MTQLRRAATALRDFARGFLGLATPLPRETGAARARLRETAERRPRCC
jgi:hypothetical protein